MNTLFKSLMWVILAFGLCLAQESDVPEEGTEGEEGGMGDISSFVPVIQAPDFNASVSIGFNYDLLKDPTRVSFDYPRGYLGLNIPLKYGLDQSMVESMTADIADLFPEGDVFEPTASAQQNANATIRVEVPMMRGVGQFSNIQNFFLRYSNTLGEPRVLVHPDIDSIDLMMQGIISVPLDLAMGWETMTFGYAYQFNDLLKVAVNLHRHIFRFDLNAKINIDLLGYFELNFPQEVTTGIGGEADELAEGAASDLLSSIPRFNINYMLGGEARGHYEVETWSPTFAIHAWRFGLTARLGINTKAPGYLSAKYNVPFFVDPETFELQSLDDMNFLMDNVGRFMNSETDSIEYRANSDLTWKMPHGITMSFDIVPDKLFITYTKLFGEIQMLLEDIVTVRIPEGGEEGDFTEEGVDFDVGVTVDHIILLHGAFRNSFINLGVFSLDFRWADQPDLLEQVYPVPFGGGALLPVLNFGTTFGAKLKLLLELDVLPLSALKTGLVYYF